MVNKEFYSETYLKTFHDSKGFIYVAWLGYLTVDQIKNGCELILTLVQESETHLMMVDHRSMNGTWSQSLKWLETNFMPRLLNAGIKKIAFIYSKDPATQYSLNRFLELNDEYQAQVFTNKKAAESWLLGTNQPFNNNLALILKAGERHHIIPFEEIDYITSNEGISQIHFDGELLTTNYTLSELIDMLPGDQFMKIHRSYVVNCREISNIHLQSGGKYALYLKRIPRVSIPISRSNIHILKEKFGI